MKPTRPALRYHGGKWRLAPWIVSHFPAHRTYIEPYGGGASVLLHKAPSYAEIYNDLDGEIVGFFRVLQNPESAAELCRAVELTPFAREEFTLSYEISSDPIERARRLLIRSFMGFGSDGHNGSRNTGFRSNSNRSHTTPAIDWRNYPAQIVRFTARLRGVVIENRNALDVIAQHDSSESLIYADPPYVHETRKSATPKQYRFEMSDDDHRELGERLNSAQGAAIVSGYKSPIYDEIFAGWRRIDKKALADGAKERLESLWLNKAASRGMLSLF